jgi:hypothetical protein
VANKRQVPRSVQIRPETISSHGIDRAHDGVGRATGRPHRREKSGYEDVILTPRSGNLGRDIIATKNGQRQLFQRAIIRAQRADSILSR